MCRWAKIVSLKNFIPIGNTMSSPTLHERFVEERNRLGHGTGLALAQALAVVPSTISKIERGVAAPSAGLLAAFSALGADVQYVLRGVRSGHIDLQLLGVCEAALRAAYGSIRTGPIGSVRSRMTATLYNTVLTNLRPTDDDTSLAMKYASQMLETLNDPAEPELLERNLFVSTTERTAGGVTVTGDSNRVAGRDMIRGGKGKA
jgi:transcriptional regulator with XRE-family HTH domain